ncbi:MAG: hypothetical protein IJT88_03805 [Kiritimatiellae bacterium]|nr:hypothetical protein [Kiritimatiellia bacterium]
MITEDTYAVMKEKYGKFGSWAVWERAGGTPSSNTGSMDWVNEAGLLRILKAKFVFVGLNVSNTRGNQKGGFKEDWKNFHSDYSRQKDFKLRFALQDTPYWGSYLTDVIKEHVEGNSREVMKHLREHPEKAKRNIRRFEEELSFLGKHPVLVAMGDNAYDILRKYLGKDGKYPIIKIPHYAARNMGKEKYREKVLKALKGQ